ncbi:MAG: hypothetical protein JNM56_03150 [Planctomycetia bacterium]|nr:hypothetical protein [Planctomycetia bacterium]
MQPPDQPPSGFDPSAFDFSPSPDSLAARMAEEQQRNANSESPLGEIADIGADLAIEGTGAVIEGATEVASAGLEIGGEVLGGVAEVAGGCFSGCCVLLVFLFLGASTVLAYVW